MEIGEILEQIKLPERSVALCLKANLQEKFDRLERQLHAVQFASDDEDTIAGSGSEARQIARQIEDVRVEMQTHTVDFHLRALPRKAWSDLLKQHPPRKGNKNDFNDYNAETFPVAALAACAVTPKMSEESAGLLVDAITNGQWARLSMAIGELNSGSAEVPFSAVASALAAGTQKS